MKSEKVLARFLEDQCEWGKSLKVSEAILYVVLSGWCKIRREELPGLVEVLSALKEGGASRYGGTILGLRLRGVDEKDLSAMLGPTLCEAVESLDLQAAAVDSAVKDSRPEWARGVLGDSVLMFVKKCCLCNAKSISSLREIYEAYVAFCDLNGRKPVREARFRSTLESPKLGVELAGRKVIGLLPDPQFLKFIVDANGPGTWKKPGIKSQPSPPHTIT